MNGSVLDSTRAPCSTAWAGMPCVTSMTRVPGAIRSITPWQTPDEVVLEPEVGEEADDHGHESTSPGPSARATAATRPSTSCVSASPRTTSPSASRDPRRLRADGDGGRRVGERRQRAGSGARREDDEVALERRRTKRNRAVQRHRVRAERVREQHGGLPPRRRRAPCQPGTAARRAALPGSRRAGRGLHRQAPPPWLRRWPRHACGRPSIRREQLPRPVGARDDDPVVGRDVDGLVPDRLDRDQRDVDDLAPDRSQTLHQVTLLARRPRDDDPRRTPCRSHP